MNPNVAEPSVYNENKDQCSIYRPEEHSGLEKLVAIRDALKTDPTPRNKAWLIGEVGEYLEEYACNACSGVETSTDVIERYLSVNKHEAPRQRMVTLVEDTIDHFAFQKEQRESGFEDTLFRLASISSEPDCHNDFSFHMPVFAMFSTDMTMDQVFKVVGNSAQTIEDKKDDLLWIHPLRLSIFDYWNNLYGKDNHPPYEKRRQPQWGDVAKNYGEWVLTILCNVSANTMRNAGLAGGLWLPPDPRLGGPPNFATRWLPKASVKSAEAGGAA